jgi:HSP20 family protein
MYALTRRDRPEDLFAEVFKPLFPVEQTSVDVLEDDTCYKILANVPGISKDNIDLDFKDSTLIVKVNKSTETTKETAKYLRRERKEESWNRSFTFDKNIDSDSIEASLKDGVLTVQVNKLSPPPKKKITIT